MTVYDRLVEELGIEHRAKAAMRALMAAGTAATPAVRRGLKHADPVVRVGCCGVLDHFLDPDAIPELLANLSHEHPGVRGWALHALACDRCKEGSCRPAEDDVIPVAMRLLRDDPDRFVRKSAVDALGPAAGRRADVLEALLAAREGDPDPLVRKVASWYCPGGRIYEGLPSRSGRRRHPLFALSASQASTSSP
jgi:HEAT repeat protein